MRLLLDTHAAVWWLTDDARLGRRADRLLASDKHLVLASPIVDLEAATKAAAGKWDAPRGISASLVRGGAEALPITAQHAEATRELPLHHRDPFDRLLVAQALVEDAVLISADERLDAYGVRRRW
ncbi:MAG: type II toxin-antitoxin system VapC family toxin [Thermoleophilia bacterium]|nr:type II toxin-antitoxin system VapC family toxin [Thermoleophilia bacterium]